MTRTKAIRKLEELYVRVPTLNCQGKCQSCCEPFRIGRVEWERIQEVTGPLKVLDRAICPMLNAHGGCSVYPIRPMLCRLWYTVRSERHPPCPHGCTPDRWLTEREATDLLLAANQISGHEFAGPCVDMESMERLVNRMLQSVDSRWL